MKKYLSWFSLLLLFGIVDMSHSSEDDVCCSTLRSPFRSVSKTTGDSSDNRSEDLDDKRPKDHYCPISHDILTDPVIAADGYTYERASIEQWFKQSSDRGIVPPNSPMTGAPLESSNLIPNFALRSLVNDWKPGDELKEKSDSEVYKIACKSPFSS